MSPADSRPQTPPDSPDATRDLPRLRHDLKNHLTAMRSGCALLERCLDRGDLVATRDYLRKMQEELRSGFALADELGDWEEPGAED